MEFLDELNIEYKLDSSNNKIIILDNDRETILDMNNETSIVKDCTYISINFINQIINGKIQWNQGDYSVTITRGE